MPSSLQNRRRVQGSWTLVTLAATSIAAHAAIVATAAFDLGADTFPSSEIELAEIEHSYSCWSDAGLAVAARSLSCSVPGLGAPDCERRAWEDFRFDLILCDGLQEAQPDAADAVAFMTEAELANVEPMPLMDVPELDELEVAQLLEEEIQEKIEKAQEEISNPSQRGQVIEVLDPGVEATPENARFLSEFDTRVEKETVARGSTEEMIARPAPKELPVDETPDELPDDPVPSGEESPEQVAEVEPRLEEGTSDEGVGDRAAESPLLAMRAQQYRERATVGEINGAAALAANGLAPALGNGTIEQDARREREGQEAVTGGSGARRSVPSLRPSEETLTRLVGGGSVDKLDGVESGEFTALNSKKWKFAGFFNRMKRQVAQNWHPDRVYVRRDPTGKVYGTKDRVTVLEVSLKPNGSLAKVVVFKQSGVDFLDDEAISAFRAAQPFPNPPTGLVDGGSQLITFSFGFHFQVGARRDAWKIFRYN